MIQLATDPNASRSNWRPAAGETRENTLASRRPRTGHAWPFLVRSAERAAAGSQDHQRTPNSSGSGS